MSAAELSGRRVSFDLAAAEVEVEVDGAVTRLPFDSAEAFDVVSDLWLRIGWDTKYVYGFSWLGRPMIQLPSDMIRIQEVVHQVQPDVILETGIAHGGSLIFYASLCVAAGRGRVIGVDVEIRPHNRAAIEAHPLAEHIQMLEGDSIAPAMVEQVHSLVQPGERVLVMLDSKHTKDHVLAELEAYAPLVDVGSYIVAADGIMADVVGGPRTAPEWTWDNPRAAAAEFAAAHPEFTLESAPTPPFNEGVVNEAPSYWRGGWLRRTT